MTQHLKENKIEEKVLLLILGYLIGVLCERWKYFKKTGEHLQNIKNK